MSGSIADQISRPPASFDAVAPREGLVVSARGELWQVVDVQAGEGCAGVRLLPYSADPAATPAVLLWPFDRFGPAGPLRRPRRESCRAWARTLSRAIASARPRAAPAAIAGASLDLLAWQLEPALAIQRGIARRVLIADHVGMGKTIQAALIARIVLDRRRDGAVLVVCPAGLRDQWREELVSRFGFPVDIFDTARLAALSRELPASANPFGTATVAVTSFDFVKQPEVLTLAAGRLWDLLVVDEAHTAGFETLRSRAVDLLGRRALHVVLLTATPHAGSDAGFERLCSIGALGRDETLAAFRRAPPAGRSGRKSRVIAVRMTPAERRLHDALARYRRVLAASPRAQGTLALLLAVLESRARSSAGALARTIERRLALLGGAAAAPVQPGLDFEPGIGRHDADEPDEVVGAPGLESTAREMAWLHLLSRLARSAADRGSKPAALVRFLRRAGEPAVIFTAYRDTLEPLAALLMSHGSVSVLHGGMSGRDRQDAVRSFVRGDSRWLLATDAACEGLNLHQRCRLVISLEVPWSPNRTEQRIGRVDRLGQTRVVHAVQFVAAGTTEESVADRADARRLVIRQALDVSREVASAARAIRWLDLRNEAEAAARACAWIREHVRQDGRDVRRGPRHGRRRHSGSIPVAFVRRRSRAARLLAAFERPFDAPLPDEHEADVLCGDAGPPPPDRIHARRSVADGLGSGAREEHAAVPDALALVEWQAWVEGPDAPPERDVTLVPVVLRSAAAASPRATASRFEPLTEAARRVERAVAAGVGAWLEAQRVTHADACRLGLDRALALAGDVDRSAGLSPIQGSLFDTQAAMQAAARHASIERLREALRREIAICRHGLEASWRVEAHVAGWLVIRSPHGGRNGSRRR